MKTAAGTLVCMLLLLAALITAPRVEADPGPNACWGQATKVFAKTGELGYHSSNQENPRLGLRNLARVLFEDGVIEDDTIQALGAFVSEDIDACIAD